MNAAIPRSCKAPAAAADAAEALPELRRRLPLVRVGDAYDLIPQLAENSVDCVITSPPYWGLRTYELEHNDHIWEQWKIVGDTSAPSYLAYRQLGGALGREPDPDWYVAHITEILNLFKRPLKSTGNMWLNLGDTYFARWSSVRNGRQGLGGGPRIRRRTPSGGYRHDKQLLLIPARVAIAMQDSGWILRNDLIWSKVDVPPRPEQDRLRMSHEHWFHFVQRSPGGRPSYYYDLSRVEPGHKDVVQHKRAVEARDHSATFPAGLVRPRIESSCPPGGFVVDPFCGSGTSLMVSVTSGRLAQGFELSPTYARAARRNVRRAHLALDQLRGAVAGEGLGGG
jgi:site-specific DNA-methyltransferase (cytosine-N4-specific)